MIAYFETSALIKLLIEEEHSDVCARFWDATDLRLTSRLTYPEARAALSAARRSQRLTSDALYEVKGELLRRTGEMTIIEATETVAWRAGDLTEQHALRGYDALHLASALEAGSDELIMVTWDADLLQAASQENLATAT